MPQSLAQIYLHIVFSTKERRAFLQNAGVRDELVSRGVPAIVEEVWRGMGRALRVGLALMQPLRGKRVGGRFGVPGRCPGPLGWNPFGKMQLGGGLLDNERVLLFEDLRKQVRAPKAGHRFTRRDASDRPAAR
jgi:hypothetical protein